MRYFLLVLAMIVLGYPACALLVHGLDPALWPVEVTTPAVWSEILRGLHLGIIADTYWQMLLNRSPAFANGFWMLMLLGSPLAMMLGWRFAGSVRRVPRDTSDLFGGARFATAGELSALSRGLELGIDPETGRAVRVAVQGTLATIAPPRKGKTSGQLIPNLAYPEVGAWSGPAVVIDPKGEIFKATAERRRAMGRRVICIDPLGLVGGEDRWNPLHARDPADVLYLQHTALALLPEATGDGEASAYFRNRAVDLITGALLVTLTQGNRTVAQVQQLIASSDLLIEKLEQLRPAPAALAALEILKSDPKTRDPIVATASQAFQWLADPRMRKVVGASTFALADLASGEVDLFVAVPPEYKRLLAPFLRWLLSDLFISVRRNRPAQRIVAFVDEAAALGRFEEILTASGELPGYGLSLWTLWQDRSQIVNLYGEAGADTIINTAEVVSLFDVPAVDPDASERWSRAIGEFTARIESLTRPAEGQGSRSITATSQGVRLLTREALASLPANQLLVFPNSTTYGRHPMRLRKTVAHGDPRFARLIMSVPPVGASA
ncbi:type VI secretion protein [Methylorubrum extorquens]|uniref:type IV secretory system conjugative DNA transfer family protein n=1 Tax=Methylorubrum extorquens TaxID=408 RepID=UPI0009726E85|nr:type IV secretory system conjugative DNA transfer family protein [Methylorubrum extorquens]APX85905.1 type VI secretion protein [Methylorubrum extorquens]